MFLIFIITWSVICGNVELIVVQVEQGKLRGELRQRSTGNGQYYSFKGIPYATPPVGGLRFKAPQPVLPWTGIKNATEHGPTCPQIQLPTGKFIPGNEDCLYLNVYTPAKKIKSCLPVMVYFGGEGFVTISSEEDQYGPDFLLDENVVIVTVNYRVGALGFLCLHIKEALGNAGLKDQVQALRWVKKNIAHFGGNPNSVTIIGQTSGGVSATLHALSPMSKGLFKRAIAMSRVFFNEYINFEPQRQGLQLAHRLGLYTNDPHEAFRFLQNASVEAIVKGRASFIAPYDHIEYVLRYLTFPPVIEKQLGDEHFLLDYPERMLLKGKTNDIDLMVGHTSMEGITRAVSQKDYIMDIFPYYKEILVPIRIGFKQNQTRVLNLGDIIQNHYFGDKEISEKNMKYFIKYFTYFAYVHQIHRFLEMWTNSGKSAYFYEFKCYSERNIYGKTGEKYGLKKAALFDDLMYLFDGKKYNLTLNKERPSYKMIKQTCALFANFAKYGNPTPNESLGITWHPYNTNQTVLLIDKKLTAERTNLTEINFWRKLYHSVGQIFS